MGHAQRTRTQRYYNNKDPLKEMKSKVKAVSAVFDFISKTYHSYWYGDEEYDEKYEPPTAKQIEEALEQLQTRLSKK